MKIVVKNTHIEVSPYKKGDKPFLEKELEIYDNIKHKISMQMYEIRDGILYLPRGYNIPKLQSIFAIDAYMYNKLDYKVKKITFKLKLKPRDKYQEQAMKFLGCVDRYSKFSKASRFNLELGTGIGKTYCAIAATWYYQVVACVFIHLDNLIDQWQERILSYTNIDKREIYKISGRKSIDDLFKNGTQGYKFYLISHKTILFYMKKEGSSKCKELLEFIGAGIKICDEAHLEFSNIIKIDLNSDVPKNFYLTATAGRSEYNENKMYINLMGNAPTLSLVLPKEQMKVIACILQFDSKPSTTDELMLSTRRGMNIFKYLDYIFKNKKSKDKTFRAINISLNTVKKIDGQIAIMVGKLDCIPLVRKYIEDNFDDLKTDIGELHSNIDKDKKQDELGKKIILTTTKSFGTGIDISSLKCIINLEPYSSHILSNQLIGRLRNKGYYIEIMDRGIKKRNKQFETVKRYINRVVKKIVINEI